MRILIIWIHTLLTFYLETANLKLLSHLNSLFPYNRAIEMLKVRKTTIKRQKILRIYATYKRYSYCTNIAPRRCQEA